MNNATSGSAGQYLGNTRQVYYSGTDQLLPGYALCYDTANSTVAERRNTVVKPTFTNLMAGGFAGVVVSTPNPTTSGTYGPGWVEIATPSLTGGGMIQVYTDVNVTSGDFLAPRADSYKFGKAVMHKPVARAVEAQDRSVTNGLCYCDYRLYGWEEDATILKRHWDDFYNPNVPGVVAGVLANHDYLLNGTTAVAERAVAGSTPATTGGGELSITGTTTTIGQIQQIGAPWLLSAGRELFCRMRVKIDDISDEDWFFGLGTAPTVSAGVLTAVAQVTSAGTTPNGTDYAGFFFDATGGNNTNINFNIRKASGTQQYQSQAAAFVNNTYIDLAFLLRNRLTGTTAGYKTAYTYLNSALTTSFETATYAAAFPDTVPLAWAMAGITGGCVGTIDRLEINYHL